MTTKTLAELAIERALSETEPMYEVVFFLPSCCGFATFAKQRKRFSLMEHASKYISMHDKPIGMHFAVLFGTRAEVLATPGMRSKKDLEDYTGDMADNPDDYRFALAILGPDKKVASTNIDNDQFRFVKREDAERTLEALKKYAVLPPLPSKQHSIEIINVKGMHGVVL